MGAVNAGRVIHFKKTSLMVAFIRYVHAQTRRVAFSGLYKRASIRITTERDQGRDISGQFRCDLAN